MNDRIYGHKPVHPLSDNLIDWGDFSAAVKSNNPAAMRWFGALLERTSYAPARRSREQNDADEAIRREWPKFFIDGTERGDVKKACLWEPVVATTGKHWDPFFQATGSCVGNGGGMAVNYIMAVEAWKKGEPEEVKYPLFYLYPYGRSRVYANLRGPGEGSFGSAFARAIKDDGITESDLPGLPASSMANGGISWGRQQELAFSWAPDGSALKQKWGPVAIKHPIQTVAQLRSSAEVAAALRNGYACTCASMWGGLMKCEVVDGVLLSRRVTEWAHQMCILGWMVHDRLGELFWIQNSWGNPHGTDPAGGPPGGFWVKPADVDFMCRDEVFAFSQFQGFPAQQIDWTSILVW